jgi:uncharacterized protein
MLNFKKHLPAIREACERHFVKRLWVFGSALTNKFGPKSDVDMVVEYDKRRIKSMATAYLGLAEDLEKTFGRPVDLLTHGPIRNPIFKAELRRTQKIVYGAKN